MSDPIAPGIESPPPSYDEVTNGADTKVPSAPPQPPTPQPRATVGAVQPPRPPPSQVVLVSQSVPLWLGPVPVRCVCANCNRLVTTQVGLQPGFMAWMVSGICCIVGCWLGCCLIPFCVDSCQDVHHICPSCGFTIGVYAR